MHVVQEKQREGKERREGEEKERSERTKCARDDGTREREEELSAMRSSVRVSRRGRCASPRTRFALPRCTKAHSRFHASAHGALHAGREYIRVAHCNENTEERREHNGRTYNGQSRRNCGGVGRNVAEALIKLGLANTRLISVVGDDEYGKTIIDSLGTGAEIVKRLPDVNTARFMVILNNKGECLFNVSEIESFGEIVPELIRERRSHLEEASLLVLDANLPIDTMRYVLDVASQINVPVWYEPTDIQKAAKIFEAGRQWQDVLHFISPNIHELRVISKFFGISVTEDMDWEVEARLMVDELSKYIPVIITTLGPRGVLVTRGATENKPFYDEDGKLIVNSSIASRLYPIERNATKSAEVVNVSGCGDCLTAGVIYGIHHNLNESNCISLALRAAALSLKSFDAVPSTLEMLSINSRKSQLV